jgi:TRAP transporter TAXI family solute receptor
VSAAQPARIRMFLTFSLVALSLAAIPCPAQELLEAKCSDLAPGGRPRLATGPADGVYLRFGRHLREFAKQLDLRPCRTEGTLENLILLSRNRAEYAIVQGELVHKGWEGEEAPEYAANEWTTIDFDRLRLVRWLFSERLQITAGPHAYISSLADLRRKHVWLGRRNGGTYSTAWEVLHAAGLTREDQREVGVSDHDEANSKLPKNSLDAVFRVTPVPLDEDKALNEEDPNFRSTITYLFHKNDEVRILSLDRPVIERIPAKPELCGSAYLSWNLSGSKKWRVDHRD